jgi:OOP family OmpA-OmpF porin
VFSATASAQRMDPNEKALLLDTRGAPVMSGGLCWHTGYGPAPLWTAGCYAERPVPVAQYVVPVAAPAPTPAPVVVAAAAPLPVYEKVAFDANVLFDSNKSVLRPADRDTLDAFVSKMSGLESQSVMAIGYADRMGTDASNQILSEKRAGAVKSYLVSKGVAADRSRPARGVKRGRVPPPPNARTPTTRRTWPACSLTGTCPSRSRERDSPSSRSA